MKCGKGKKGWKFGKSGKCYTGKDAKEKAKKQGVAIKISQGRKKYKCSKEVKSLLKRINSLEYPGYKKRSKKDSEQIKIQITSIIKDELC